MKNYRILISTHRKSGGDGAFSFELRALLAGIRQPQYFVADFIGVAASTVTYWKKGLRFPRQANLEALLDVLRQMHVTGPELERLADSYRQSASREAPARLTRPDAADRTKKGSKEGGQQ